MIDITDSTAIAQVDSDEFSSVAGRDADGLSAIHRAALAYATRLDPGWRILPISPTAKRPLVKGWPDRASRKPDTIAKWLAQWPDARIGVATGSGLVAIDVDPKNGGLDEFDRLVAGRELPETARASSPSGGFHLYFRCPWRIKSRPLPGYRGIDVKADGGQIVLPPSGHASGGRYAWEREPFVRVARMPDWLVEIARAETARAAKRKGSQPSTVAGGREDDAEIPHDVSTCNPAVFSIEPEGEPIPRNVGDVAALTGLAIARHGIPGQGYRHDRARALIGELCRAGYDAETVRSTIRGWTEHYLALGRVGSTLAEADADHESLIAYTLANPEFAPREPAADWSTRIARYTLTATQSRLLAGRVAEIREIPQIAATNAANRVRPAREDAARSNRDVTRITDRLCFSDSEAAFAESLVVRAALDLRAGRWFFDGDQLCIPLTDETIAEVAKIRRGIVWDRKQTDRLKSKYLTRLSKGGELSPATVFEFAIEVEKGKWGRALPGGGRAAGRPSVYGLSGVLAFIDLAGDAGRIREAMQRKRSDVIRGPPWRAGREACTIGRRAVSTRQAGRDAGKARGAKRWRRASERRPGSGITTGQTRAASGASGPAAPTSGRPRKCSARRRRPPRRRGRG